MSSACFVILVACLTLSVDAADVTIRPLQRYTNEFSGRETVRTFCVKSDQPLAGRFIWSVSAQGRTLARGEQEFGVAGQAADAAVRFRLNQLRDEVVLPVTLTVAAVVEQVELARQETRLRLFPEDPFGPRSKWLRWLDVTLFDPVGRTARQFDEARVPYRSVHTVAALSDPDHRGLLVIGEGVSLRKHRSLANATLRAAAAGRRIVLLAPTDGSLTVPGTSHDGLPDKDAPGELLLARGQIITELDKRLDADVWPGSNDTVPSSKFLLAGHHGRIEATVSVERQAWPWLEAHFPASDGVLVVCGFQVIEHWNRSPAPRYLLLRLFESLSPTAFD